MTIAGTSAATNTGGRRTKLNSRRDATRSPSAPRPRPLDTPESTSEAERERRELERRQLHVGMTRAGDGLWVATHAY